ncbi:hypothetical protein [Nonomuraea sp. NPDC005650]
MPGIRLDLAWGLVPGIWLDLVLGTWLDLAWGFAPGLTLGLVTGASVA